MGPSWPHVTLEGEKHAARAATAAAAPADPTDRATQKPALTRAVVDLNDRRYVLDGPSAVLGRSDDAACVLRDPNVSRRHAELRQDASGQWEIVDLGSTNGVKVNGRRVTDAPLREGDQVTVGTTTFRFGIER